MSGSRAAEALRRVECLRPLPHGELAELAAGASLRTMPAGRTFRVRTDPPAARFVLQGSVRLFHRAPGGREVTVARVEPGEPVDVGFVLPEVGAQLRAQAETEATLCRVDVDRLRAALGRHPAAMLRLVEQIGARLLAVEERLDEHAGTDARARVVAALLRVERERGREIRGERYIEGVAQRTIAQQAGVSRETVSRVLGRLGADGLVRRDRGRYVLAMPDRLARIAAGGR